MHYEINISLNGQHYFATNKRSITTKEKAKEIYNDLKSKFSEKVGIKLV